MDKISEVITRKAEAVLKEFQQIQAGTLLKKDAKTIQELIKGSQAAIFGGRGSDAWKDYMKLFVGDNPENLDRLVPPVPDLNEARERARCYLVRNGRCSEGTTGNMLNTVENALD